MVSCCVPDCKTTHRNNPCKYSFHRFPRNPDLRKIWLRAIDRKNWTPHKYSHVCEKHFEEKCYIEKELKRLSTDSIPTLFVSVKVTERMPSSYVHRNEPGTSRSFPMEPKPGSPNTPMEKKLVAKCSKLKQKIAEKNKSLRGLRALLKRMHNRIVTLKDVIKALNKRPSLLSSNGNVSSSNFV